MVSTLLLFVASMRATITYLPYLAATIQVSMKKHCKKRFEENDPDAAVVQPFHVLTACQQVAPTDEVCRHLLASERLEDVQQYSLPLRQRQLHPQYDPNILPDCR
jgi:hypothetical protein